MFARPNAAVYSARDDSLKTTLHSRPMQEQNDAVAKSMEGGLGAGPNTLPDGFTDKSLVRIPVRVSDYLDLGAESQAKPAEDDPSIQEPKSKGLLSKFHITSPKVMKKTHEGYKAILMTRGDYLRYWAKDERDQFLPTVTTPPEGRAEWIRKQLIWQEEHAKNAHGAMKKETDLKSSTVNGLVMAGTAVIGGAG